MLSDVFPDTVRIRWSGCKDRFVSMFQQQLHQFGVTFSVGPIQLGAVKEQMKTNLLATMERGDNLEDIEVGTRDLMDGAQRFNQTSSALKRMMCCKNLKMTILLTLFILVILTVIIVIAVCTQGDSCKQKKDNNNGNWVVGNWVVQNVVAHVNRAIVDRH